MPVRGSQRPNTAARCTSQAARYCSAPRRSYSCSTRAAWWGPGRRVGWRRARAWMLVFSSALSTNSSGPSGAPAQVRAYRSSTRPARSRSRARAGRARCGGARAQGVAVEHAPDTPLPAGGGAGHQGRHLRRHLGHAVAAQRRGARAAGRSQASATTRARAAGRRVGGRPLRGRSCSPGHAGGQEPGAPPHDRRPAHPLPLGQGAAGGPGGGAEDEPGAAGEPLRRGAGPRPRGQLAVLGGGQGDRGGAEGHPARWPPGRRSRRTVPDARRRCDRRRAVAHWRPCPPPGRPGGARPPPGCPTVVPTLQPLLEAGPATRGLAVSVRGGHLILARADDLGPDPRFRLTPLGGTAYGLSLYRRKRWEALPYHGTLQELVDVMNTDLQHWAADWP